LTCIHHTLAPSPPRAEPPAAPPSTAAPCRYATTAAEYRCYIKHHVLRSVGAPHAALRTTIGTVISVVAVADGLKSWPELPNGIVQCLYSDDYDHTHGALDALYKVRLLGEESSRGEAESSLGDAKSSLGDAESLLGDAEISRGDPEGSLGDAESSLGDAKSSLGDAEGSLGDAESSLGDAERSLGDA
jgi:hypothetical protein